MPDICLFSKQQLFKRENTPTDVPAKKNILWLEEIW